MTQQDIDPHTGSRMPAVFIGHGSPMNALEDNEFSRLWNRVGRSVPRPKAILCISAHWETVGTRVTAVESPRTLHDFGGFPKALFDLQYPAPGNPALAQQVQTIADTAVAADFDWGLDHGAWSVLCRMYPEADIPVVQLSLDRAKTPAMHYALGKTLRVLRSRGVLILGSGNLVHNLRTVAWQDTAYDWARAVDEEIKRLILSGDHDAIIHFDRRGEAARLAVPSPEHFLPLLYILALQEPEDAITFFADKVTLGSIAMRSLIVGQQFDL